MAEIFSGIAVAFLITFLVIPIIIRVAKIQNWLEKPVFRSIHSDAVPAFGGIGVLVSFLTAFFIFLPDTFGPFVQWFTASLAILFLMGLRDDFNEIRPSLKLLAQLVAVLLICWAGGLRINAMYGVFGLQEIQPVIQIVLTAFLMMAIINAYNFIDGFDLLAAIHLLIPAVFFGSYFIVKSETGYALLVFSFSAALLAFSVYNMPPARIFLGDNGSHALGLLVSILLVKFIELQDVYVNDFQYSPALAFGLVSLPLVDLTRVFFIWIFNRRSPLKPNKIHIHHIMLSLNIPVWLILMLLTFLTFTCIAIPILLDPWGNGSTNLMISMQVFVMVLFYTMIFALKKRQKKKILRNAMHKQDFQ